MEVNFIDILCYYYIMSKFYYRYKCLVVVCFIKLSVCVVIGKFGVNFVLLCKSMVWELIKILY